MGRYIDEILQPGERVLYSTNEHWIFFLPAIAAWIVAVAFLVLLRLVSTDALMLVCLALAAIAGLAALYRTATAWFHRWTTETVVTKHAGDPDHGPGARRLDVRGKGVAAATTSHNIGCARGLFHVGDQKLRWARTCSEIASWSLYS